MKKAAMCIAAGTLLLSCSLFKKGIVVAEATPKPVAVKSDSATKLKPYSTIITAKAISKNGLFKVHQVNDRYYFEIPDALLNKDLLLVNRISKGNYNGPFTSNGGKYLAEFMLQFCKGPNNRLFWKQMNYVMRTSDTSVEDGMQRSIDNSNMQPIIAAFDVKAVSPDSSGVVIDVTDLLNSDYGYLSFTEFLKSSLGYGLSGLHADKSYIADIRSYPQNVEIKTVKTYTKGGGVSAGVVPPGNVTYEINNSIVLLPERVMPSRLYDTRVGYFAKGYYDYQASQSVQVNWMITRWRLEPKEEDIERYKRGELVEPRKPIVYYIDPATPQKWVPYLVQGVNAWQQAFEKAGFKNAIYAMKAPVGDTTWSVDDARHNVIVYKASATRNASGAHVADPRSGEILETHIDWYHNVTDIMRDMYFVQAAPNDPAARKMNFDDSLMGKLIRYVCTHEVGHTLGLRHNFVSSATVPVDSLRSKTYVRANGFCPSIMDYSRFNYVAQPEDGFEQKDLLPRIGVYDEWAIEWGYRWLPAVDTLTIRAHQAYMNKWIMQRTEGDPRLEFGFETIGQNADPRLQSEDLGDDAIKAGKYGIRNLQRIVSNLKEWTRIPNNDYSSLGKLYGEVLFQYMNYLGHGMSNIAGKINSEKTVEQQGAGIRYIDRAIQKASVQFLHEELFTEPAWLINHEIYLLTAKENDPGTKDLVTLFHQLNEAALYLAFNHNRLWSLLVAQSVQLQNAYRVEEYVNDLANGIWKELTTKAPIQRYRRDLQKMYLARLIDLLNIKNLKPVDQAGFATTNMDVEPILKAHLRSLLAKIDAAMPAYKDELTRYHLMELSRRGKKVLAGKNIEHIEKKANASATAFNITESRPVLLSGDAPAFNTDGSTSCWEHIINQRLFIQKEAQKEACKIDNCWK